MKRTAAGQYTPPPGRECDLVHLTNKRGRLRLIKDMPKPEHVLRDLYGVLPESYAIFYPGVHSSAVRDKTVCKRITLFRERLGLRFKGEYKSALWTGSAFHLAMAGLGRGDPWPKVQTECQEWYSDELRLVQEQVNRMGLLPSGKSLKQVQEQMELDFWKALAMAAVFASTYHRDAAEGLGQKRLLGTEIEIQAKYVGKSVPLVGTVDYALWDPDAQTIEIGDYKTTSGIPSEEATAFGFDLQPHLYRLLAMCAWPDYPITHFIHNVVEKPTIKYCGKDPTPADYIKRVEQWYDDTTTKREKEKAPVLRSRVAFIGKRPPRDILGHIEETAKLLTGNIDLAKYPRCSNKYVCMGIGGKDPCPYLALCQYDHPRNWRGLLSESGPYQQEHRDFPLKVLDQMPTTTTKKELPNETTSQT